ncbi:ribbon-helix-helix domain-containing protein [Clostridium sporogenes]|uniref:ribbon-helix-helix domain-containing protein n=1 Tax=Clostridium sporogenes TaxID=1509 RepID=UPI0013D79F42|nr:DNA-binding protein [Clostridium sporogenes]
MTISKDNTRTLITIPKELKKQLEQLAKDDHRSFNNLVVKILKSYVDNSSHD